MKTAFSLLFIVVSSLLIAKPSRACSPPPQKYGFQQVETQTLFTNKLVDKKIYELAGPSAFVKSVVVDTHRTYVITLTNGCNFTATPKWLPAEGAGACPRFDGFTVAGDVCPNSTP